MFYLPEHMKELNIIVLTRFGSHLYGTDTPESDTDIKGIFLPTKEEVLLGKIPRCVSCKTKKNEKNTKDDIDIEIFSLHYFLELACNGETIALDMLHTPDNMTLQKTKIWDDIVSNRSRFYTKSLKSFVGYARKQAAKYGVKGSRLSDAKRVLDYLNSILSAPSNDIVYKLRDFWSELPTGEHIHFLPPNEKSKFPEYQVCGKRFQNTCLISYVVPILESFVQSYGERARQAEANEGIDWKAVSHALRAAYQIEEILTEGTITFPLKQATFLKRVKKGEVSFIREVSPLLENIMNRVELLSEESMLPDKADRKFWEKYLINVIESNVLKNLDILLSM